MLYKTGIKKGINEASFNCDMIVVRAFEATTRALFSSVDISVA